MNIDRSLPTCYPVSFMLERVQSLQRYAASRVRNKRVGEPYHRRKRWDLVAVVCEGFQLEPNKDSRLPRVALYLWRSGVMSLSSVGRDAYQCMLPKLHGT